MTRERKDKNWEQCIALIPINAELRATGRPTLVGGNENGEEKKSFYEALLKISWLPPKIRRAVMNELGLSLRAKNNDFNHGMLLVLRLSIAEEKERLKNAGERPRGGIHEAAMQNVARRGLKVETLKKRLQNRKKQASRRSQKK